MKTFTITISETLQADVTLDGDDLELSEDLQIMVATTQAVERLKPITLPNIILTYAQGDCRAFMVYSYVIIGNLGNFHESYRMQRELETAISL
jgi:hypothetical protein